MTSDSREFWVQIRRGLILIIDAIDARFALPSVRSAEPKVTVNVSATAPPNNGFVPPAERGAHGASSIHVRKDGS